MGKTSWSGMYRNSAAALAAVCLTSFAGAVEPDVSAPRRPNFVVILCDNLGYGDIGCFGSPRNRTPALDRMAAEGMRLTSFYVTSGVCTPSRASLMTGCYPRRVNLHVDANGTAVLRPVARRGLHPNEITIAEVLKSRGYHTACIGKWHLGDQPIFLPTRQGFDEYFGIPYSDDMTKREGQPWPPLPLMENERVVEAPAERETLTRRYTERVIDFIRRHRDEPFFVYLPHAMPGSTRQSFAGEAFRGKSANGRYGDAVEEIDWSTGEILRVLKELDLDKRTMVLWTSDNGSVNRQHSSNRPLSGWGYTTTEGGMRVPCVVRWPGTIPAGTTSDEPVSTMDLLPSLAGWAGADVPDDRIIDGRDIRPLLLGTPGATSPHQVFYYYYLKQLQAVRSGKWKLHLPLEKKWTRFGRATVKSRAELFDVKNDAGEQTNLAEKHPEVVDRLLALAEQARVDLGDVDRPGKNQRPAGHVETPTPRVIDED